MLISGAFAVILPLSVHPEKALLGHLWRKGLSEIARQSPFALRVASKPSVTETGMVAS
jgi:hypothetical protein